MIEPHADTESLPFHAKTLLVRIALRWKRLLFVALVAISVGSASGVTIGSREYEAGTVLLYRPAGNDDELRAELPLATQLNLVKVRANLEATRARIELPAPLDVVGRAVDVRVQGETDLLTIVARWEDGQTAADLANTLRDVFLTNQARIRLRDAMNRLNVQIDRTDEEQRRLTTQVESLEAIMNSLSGQAERQQQEQQAVASLGELNIRIQRTRDAIIDDRAQRMNEAKLEKFRSELAQAESLAADGLISRAEHQRIRSEYEAQKALTVDTKQVGQWKAQLEDLQSLVIPSDATQTPASWALQQVMVKAADLEFDQVGATETLRQLRQQRTRLAEEQSALEEANFDTQLARTAIKDPDLTDFQVISDANVPVIPVSSNRRLLAIGVSGIVFLLGTIVVVAAEMFSRRLKSSGELELRTGLRVLGSLPRTKRHVSTFPEFQDAHALEQVRLLARSVRRVRPGHGARILVTSARVGEGVTAVITNLASCIGRQGERVLIVDAHVRQTSTAWPDTRARLRRWFRWGQSADREALRYSELVTPSPSKTGSLEEALASDGLQLRDAVRKTRLSNVDCLLSQAGLDTPDPLASPRMRKLLEHASDMYDLVLIDAPPANSGADATLLSGHVEAVLLVVASQATTVSDISAARSRLQTGGDVIGAVLNRVEPAFQGCV